MPAPTREDIIAAAARISGHVRRTPILELDHSAGVPNGTVLKLDLLQPTGTFKIRGAFNLLAATKRPERVVAASGGNFALAIAHAARELAIVADLFVPDSSPPEKIERISAYGAKVHVIAGVYHHALAASREFAADSGAVEAHAYDLPEVVAGAGTCGMEIAAQVPTATTVLVAVGGGGLIGGISSWFRGDAKVIGVETEGTPSMHAAIAAGQPIDVEVSGLAVSSLGSNRIGDIPWDAISQWVEGSILVSDDEVRAAQRWLWNETRLIAEPGAATTVAALLTGRYQPEPGEKVVALVCGANTDPGSVI
ncbi:MAG: threonine/serine dehydratase [Actinomycetota bacterium]